MRKTLNHNAINGWLIVDKPRGISSFKVVSTIKRILKPKKIGHAGTLDPEATGVLAVALGESTKTIPYQTNTEKNYTFKIVWGKQTDSDDSEGKIINESRKRPDKYEILDILPLFLGNLKQMPPIFSAKKINGKKAYDLARSGQVVNLRPANIQVFKLDLIKVWNKNSAEFFLSCGKGTYVRSIARDVGSALGCFGYAKDIRRTCSGGMDIKRSIEFSLLKTLEKIELIDLILPTQEVLKHIREIKCNELQYNRIKNGQSIKIESTSEGFKSEVWASYKENPVAIGIIDGEVFSPKRILNIFS